MSHNCNKCKKTTCTCSPLPVYVGGCAEKIDANCVYYNFGVTDSNILKYINLPGNTPIKLVLEKLDLLLDGSLNLEVPVCAESLLNIDGIISIKQALLSVITKLCTLDDSKVKVSVSDSSNGRLSEKLTGVECLKTRIVTDTNGNQTLEAYIDYECLATKLPQCITVSCCGGGAGNFNITTDTEVICGTETALLTADSCSGTINCLRGNENIGVGSTISVTEGYYYAVCGEEASNLIIIQNEGTCNCISTSWEDTGIFRCENYISQKQQISNCGKTKWVNGGDACVTCQPIWEPVLPVEIYCGQYLNSLLSTTIYNTCTMYIKHKNQCNTQTDWFIYTGSGSEDAGNCPGCNQPTYIATRTASFLRNNCDSNCTPSSVEFTRTYSSSVSQSVADSLKVSGLTQFNIDGQAFANSTGTCTNCTCIPTDSYTASVSQNTISFKNSCNNSIGAISLNVPYYSCGIISGVANIYVSSSHDLLFNPSNYLIEYAITKINGVAVGSPVYQQGSMFEVDHNKTYTITLKVTIGGVSQSVEKNITVSDCTLCTSPLGTIYVQASATSICGDDVVVLTATGSNCDTIEWIKDNIVNEETLGYGMSITVAPRTNSIYRAICRNCAGNVHSSSIYISYTSQCAQVTYTSTQTRTVCESFTKECQPGFIGNSVQYCQTATRTATSTTSQQDADNWAGVSANYAAAQLVSANGQAYANTNGTCIPTGCTPVWTNTGITKCGGQIDTVLEPVTTPYVELCSTYEKQTNQCNSAIRWILLENTPCDCKDYGCLVVSEWENDGLPYCQGENQVQDRVDQCGMTDTIILGPCPCQLPSNIAINVTSKTQNNVTVNISYTGGTTYRYCNNSTFICTNSCQPGDGSSGDSEVLIIPAGTSATYTFRIYNGTNCSCYTDVTQIITNDLECPIQDINVWISNQTIFALSSPQTASVETNIVGGLPVGTTFQWSITNRVPSNLGIGYNLSSLQTNAPIFSSTSAGTANLNCTVTFPSCAPVTLTRPISFTN